MNILKVVYFIKNGFRPIISAMKYIRKLSRLKFQSVNKKFSDLLILKDEIDREKRILAGKRWFYEKLVELEKSKK